MQPYLLTTKKLREGQIAFADVTLKEEISSAYEICCQCEDGEFAPVLVLNPLDTDKLNKVGYTTPRMVWGSLNKNIPQRTISFVVPKTGIYAVTQEKGIGVVKPTITARMSVKNGFAEKFTRLLDRCRWKLSRFYAPCEA